MKKIYMLVASFALAGLVVLVPAVAGAVSQIYISGVRTSGGSGHTTDDFIELFNPGATTVNLKDFKLVKRTAQATADSVLKSWTEDILIPAYSFYLWANASFGSIATTPDTTSSGSVADDNGVGLRVGSTDSGQLIDSLAWGQTGNSFALVSGNVPAGSVLQRQDLFAPQSAYVIGLMTPRNSAMQVMPIEVIPPDPDPPVIDPPPVVAVDPPVVAVDPPASDPPASDPPQETSPPIVVPPIIASPIVYLPLEITEILPNPIGTDTGQEAVELYNPNNIAVDITGWFLGDGASSLPASNAYELSGFIDAGQYKAMVIPSGKFTLNNTGGETVKLFSPDKNVADSITYTGTAGENQSFQKFAGEWQWLDSSLGLVNAEPPTAEDSNESEEDVPEPAITYGGISISEFYSAFGEELVATPWLEVFNRSDKEIDLSQWQVDVASTHLKKPSDSALVMENTNVVPPDGYGTVALANLNSNDFEPTGKYWVILYSPDGKSQDAVNVKSIVSRLSYAKVGSLSWQWTVWSPAGENKPLAPPNIQFTELFPAYKDAETDAFVEFQNPSAEPIYLGNLKIKIGTKSAWLPDYTLQPKEYYAMFAEDLPAVLTTAGKKVLLVDANDKLVTQVSYPKAKTGLALMVQPDRKWVWTAEPTPGEENVWEAAEGNAVKKTSAAKAAAKPAAKPMATTIPKLSNPNVLPPEESGAQPKKSKKPMWIFGVVGAILLALAAVIWFVAKEPEPEEVSES